jgi:uncharacterized protein YndB with AHSA1/START domain
MNPSSDTVQKTEPVTFATFTIERVYAAKPSRVFAAFVDPASKRKWFAESEGMEVVAFELDFRVGGIEKSRFRFKTGANMGNDTVFQDIVQDRRIVSAYVMTMGEKRISASLATIELFVDGDGTKLVYTEQAAFFEGADGAKMREAGWTALLGNLTKHLDEKA